MKLHNTGRALLGLGTFALVLDWIGRWQTIIGVRDLLPFLALPWFSPTLFVAGIGLLYWSDVKKSVAPVLYGPGGVIVEKPLILLGKQAIRVALISISLAVVVATTWWLVALRLHPAEGGTKKPIAQLTILQFVSNAMLVIGNNTDKPLYVTELDVNLSMPSASFGSEMPINAEIPAFKTYMHDFKSTAAWKLQTIPSLGPDWDAHYGKAMLLYKNCLEMVYLLPTEAMFVTARNFYEAHHESLWTRPGIGTLHYHQTTNMDLREEKFALTVVPMNRVGCKVE